MNSRILKTKDNVITQKYKKGMHDGIDIVGSGRTLDYVVAHSDGVIANVRSDYNKTDKTGNSYGNYVLIKHSNGMYTLYAHLKYNSITVKVGQKVERGQIIGYMGNTGHSIGAHLHFEVRDKNNNKIDPTNYINSNLFDSNSKDNIVLEWQKVMNKTYNCGIAEDNSYGPDSKANANKYYLLYKFPTIKNEHVKFIQERLIEKGYSVGESKIDGSYGKETEKAVKEFQKAMGIEEDGYVGEKTTELLLK